MKISNRPLIKFPFMCFFLIAASFTNGFPPLQHFPAAIADNSNFEERLRKIINPLSGVPYRYGGTSVKGFDCSGFSQYVYKKLDIDLPRASYQQYEVGKKVTIKNMQVGDLIFFDTNRDGKVNHLGIYLGNNKMAHAGVKSGISIQDLGWYYKNYRVMGVRRVK